jgi:CBS domain-containing protein
MATSPPVLAPETPVADAVSQLLDNHLLSMPVVDHDRHFLGMFSKRHVLSALLPAVATHGNHHHQMERMIEARLLSNTFGEVCERYAAIAADPVRNHLETAVTVLHPDQPLVGALLFLLAGHNLLPVIDPGSRVLVGVVSTWDVLKRIATQS